MPKKSKAHEPALPSREAVIAYIASADKKVGKREIARAFNIHGDDRIRLKEMLRDLEDDGALSRRGKRVQKPGRLPHVVVADIKSRDRDGELIAEPEEWDADTFGPPP